MKAAILDLLACGKTVSGNSLSKSLGISRVSIWKHIQRLQALGYSIKATSKGYRLIRRPVAAYPWEMGAWQHLVHYYNELPSTMDRALRLAHSGCPGYTTVVAAKQTSGRGRLDRKWESDPGGLYFTVVLRPEISPAEACRINLAAAVDLALTLKETCLVEARVKWPNDVMVHGRKLAGILSQMEAETDRVSFVNVGIGVNLENHGVKAVPQAISLVELTGRRFSASTILRRFLDRFSSRFDSGGLDEALEKWRQINVTLNREVTVVTLKERLRGFARDIDSNGGLILQMPDGTKKAVAYGDCFHSRPTRQSGDGPG